ncbi:MAG: hypothetical protein IPH39_21275 [Sulfuritalea sp.]|nr:hypothetical protein [Sulfuritalea sp.]
MSIRISALGVHHSTYLCLIACCCTWLGGCTSHARISHVSRELAVRLPLAAQVMLAGGDRYLAANMLGIRVLVVETFRMSPQEFDIQARLQRTSPG